VTNINYEDLIAEKDVYERYGDKLVHHELLDARKDGLIDFVKMRKGIYYTQEQLRAYISRQVVSQCPKVNDAPAKNSNSANTGLVGKPAESTSTVIGMTPELEKLAAGRLRRRHGKKQS